MGKFKYTPEEVFNVALKYQYKTDFFNGAHRFYKTAKRMGIFEQVTSHMDCKYKDFSDINNIYKEAKNFKTRSSFKTGSGSAYNAAVRLGIFEDVCSHMPKDIKIGKPASHSKWTNNKKAILIESSRFETRKEFSTHSRRAYEAAKKMGVLDEVCSHMKDWGSSSAMEEEIFNLIKSIFPNTKKLRDRKVNIKSKKHIKGFDIDSFVPELSLGIEFDGKYHHSFDGLKRSRKNWPDQDIKNYHKIKDDWFLSIGIKILHIKEEDWISNKQLCVDNIFSFLGVSLIREQNARK